MKYAWIERHRECWPVSLACEVLGVSPSGYHDHKVRSAKPRRSLSDAGAYSDALANMFADFAAVRHRYDQGEFVHSNALGVTGGGAMTAEFYGEIFIPEEYAKRAYSNWFRLERFLFDPQRQSHPILFFRRI